jgi:hypothetical protein
LGARGVHRQPARHGEDCHDRGHGAHPPPARRDPDDGRQVEILLDTAVRVDHHAVLLPVALIDDQRPHRAVVVAHPVQAAPDRVKSRRRTSTRHPSTLAASPLILDPPTILVGMAGHNARMPL